MKNTYLRAAFVIALFAAASQAQATYYASNLITNSTAEDGTVGWNAFDGISLIQTTLYDSVPGIFLYPDAAKGASMFTGSNSAYAAGWQRVNVFDINSTINTGEVTFSLSGYLGGMGDQEDNTLFYVSFLDAMGSEIDHTELGPNYLDLRDNLTVLANFNTSGYIPVGTTSIMFTLSMEGTDGDSRGAFADNLNFQLSNANVNDVPEPGSSALVLLGLTLLGAAMKRRSV